VHYDDYLCLVALNSSKFSAWKAKKLLESLEMTTPNWCGFVQNRAPSSFFVTG